MKGVPSSDIAAKNANILRPAARPKEPRAGRGWGKRPPSAGARAVRGYFRFLPSAPPLTSLMPRLSLWAMPLRLPVAISA